MSKTFHLAILLLSAAQGAFAGDFGAPVTLTGMTQLGETAELRFDQGSANTGELVILGSKATGASVEQKFTYDVHGASRKSARGAAVEVHFNDKQSLKIHCDPFSDNCSSSGYVTESGAEFSILWMITRD